MSKAVVAKSWTGLTEADGVSYSNPAKAPDGQAPTTPGTPTVTAAGSSALSLSWTASTDDSGVAEYIVYRSTTLGGTYTEIARTITNAYTDTDLPAATTRYYKIRAVDASPQANESAQSAAGNGTTGAAPSGDWQLDAGHWAPAGAGMVVAFPRADAGPDARHKWAYYDGVNNVQYRIPITIDGGAEPFFFEKITGPSWLSINGNYSKVRADDYGVLKGTPDGTYTDEPIKIRVSDQDGNSIDIDFTLSTSSSKFLFVNSSTGNNANSGTIGSPLLNTRGWYLDDPDDRTYAGKIVYYRAGTHTWYLDPSTAAVAAGNTNAAGSGDFIDDNKPMSHIGYPGETVHGDFSQCQITFANAAKDWFYGGMSRKNSKLKKSRYFAVINATCHTLNGGGEGFCWFDSPMENHHPSYIKATEDLTGTNTRGETYEWVNVAGTNEYYCTVDGGAEAFVQFNSANDRPGVLTAGGSTYPRQAATAVLAPSQWKWAKPTGRTYYTVVIYLADGTSPATKGSDYVLASSWPGVVGTNAGGLWSDESGKAAGPEPRQNGRRKYIVESRCDRVNVGRHDFVGGYDMAPGEIGAPPMWLLNAEHVVIEWHDYTYCSGPNSLSPYKESCRRVTVRYFDATDATNEFAGDGPIKMSVTNLHDLNMQVEGLFYRWGKVRKTNTLTNDALVRWFTGSVEETPGQLGLATARLTLVNDTATAKGGCYYGGGSYTCLDIASDLCVTHTADTDGWPSSTPSNGQVVGNVGNSFVGDYALVPFSSLSTYLDAAYEVKPSATGIYGLFGATVA